MYKRMPKTLRRDSVMLRLGTTYRRIRKDRDGFELVDRPDNDARLSYELMEVGL